jgi:antirestriction protein ArdC
METDGSFRISDIYARVTDEIVRAIEAGAEDYEMPWHQRAGAGGPPRNALTGNFYRGVNTVALWAAGQLQGYARPHWATFLQWKKLGARIRRGEKASVVVFYKQRESPTDDEGHQKARRPRRILRSSFVFNAEQVDGWSQPEPPCEDRTEKLRKVDSFIETLGANIHYGSDIACYSPKFDRIHMPDRRDFIDRVTSTATEGFYSVLLHEHVHWTGHPKRLNRGFSGRFGDSTYAMEELVAELGAAFLCGELGINVHPRQDHAAYVADWLVVLRHDKTAIFTAASTATAACRFLAELTTARAQQPA